MTTLEQALQNTARRLAVKGIETAGLDASLLVQVAAGCSRLELILNGDEALGDDAIAKLEELVLRREKREPLAYILGEKEFWGLTFKVTPDVLVPRPDTETLIAVVLNLLPDRQMPIKFADIGVGSGAIILSLLSEFPQAQAYGVDISAKALDVAWQNGERLGIADRVTWIEGDGAAALPETVSLIVSNPPYISEAEYEKLQLDVKNHEPQLALLAGEEGLDVYRSLIPQAYDKLHSGGLLVLEIGHKQQQAVRKLLKEKEWQDVTCYQDLAGRDRVLAAIRR
ncbi:MAG: peptide chain release factor N(5)-glutamine methyltransferase [Alphaproteobacteria bacterium]|nr:peptide chain release factor N(5)-glutamine methyltransferase [Alphaproteobacteria bacterium]MDD9919426.1 peptide chain release factor N(5)-glutamine methyltransferase [Alphaproteobacteria bacterium]